MNIERTKNIKMILFRCSALKDNMIRTLNETATIESGRYSAFKTYAEEYTNLAYQVSKIIDLSSEKIRAYNVDTMNGWADTLWPQQKAIIESVVVYTDILISLLENEIDFANDEYSNLENFLKTKLRTVMFEQPAKEKDVQNAIEMLFVGRGWNKGIDYDRESGKFEFSGKEYIPDFIVNKLGLCIEVKLLKENRRSKVIEEINADITAYSKEYKRQLFVVYDLGFIRDEIEFKRDIENSGDEIRVIVVKH
ncbi:MAG: hypothetical protein K2I80_07055 [Ruminococcus sp.]|nr:hypothetical protein [Ruminococcus sp.]